MPKYKPETERTKAINTAKSYIDAGLNQSKLARRRGVHRSTINKTIARPPVQKAIQDEIMQCLQEAGIASTKVYKRLNEQLDATRTISAVISPDGKQKDANGQTCDFIEVADHSARDKAIDKCLTLMGHLKQQNGKNGHDGDVSVGIFDFGQVDSQTRRSLIAVLRKRRSEGESV